MKKLNILNRTLVFTLLTCLLGCSPSGDKTFSVYEKTSQAYDELLKQSPNDFALRLEIAGFYYRFKDYGKVKEILAASDDKQAETLLAKAYVQSKDYTRAIEIFEQIGEESEDAEYLYLYARTLEEKKLFSRAVKLYEKLPQPYKKLGEERVKKIGVKIEEGVPQKIIAARRKHAEFLSRIKEEDTVILFIDEEIEIRPDNTMVSTVHLARKILREKGKELGEVQIGYDSTYERVELEYARTVTPEGKLVYAGAENIRDVSKYLNFPLYSNAKAFIVSMPSVEVGSIIEYKVKIYSSKLINDDDFDFIYRLRDYYPIARQAFKLFVPENREVGIKFINQEYADGIDLSPKVTEENNRKLYYWEFEEVDPIIPEERMPNLSMVNPAIVISSFQSWEEIYNWWHGLFKDKIELTEEMKNFVDDLIKDCVTEIDKAKKIYEFCIKDVRYVGVEYGESGYEPHTAEEVFINRYGDCKDKATLLVAMMRYAGLEAYPVLIPTREAYPIYEDFPSVNFNHAIAAVKIRGDVIFMDGTAYTTSFFDLPLSDQERAVLVFFEDKHQVMTTPLIKDNEILYEMQINIDSEENAAIKRKVITNGSYAAYHRYYLKYTHPQKIRDNIRERMKEISPLSKLIDHSIKNVDDFDKSPVLEYDFETKKFLNPAKNLRIIPLVDDIGIDVAYAGKEKRNFPIDFMGIFKKRSRVKVNLPPELKVKYLPQDVNYVTKWFDFISTYDDDKGNLTLYQEFFIKERFVKQDEYAEFKKSLEDVFYLLRGEVILERKRR